MHFTLRQNISRTLYACYSWNCTIVPYSFQHAANKPYKISQLSSFNELNNLIMLGGENALIKRWIQIMMGRFQKRYEENLCGDILLHREATWKISSYLLVLYNSDFYCTDNVEIANIICGLILLFAVKFNRSESMIVRKYIYTRTVSISTAGQYANVNFQLLYTTSLHVCVI